MKQVGQNAHGYAEHYVAPRTEPGRIRGTVTCLQVSGERAVIGGPLDEPIEIGGFLWTHYAFEVVDADPATPGPDLISDPTVYRFLVPPSEATEDTFCTSHFARGHRLVTSGGLIVEDAVCDKKLKEKKDGELKCKESKDGEAPAPLDTALPLAIHEQLSLF